MSMHFNQFINAILTHLFPLKAFYTNVNSCKLINKWSMLIKLDLDYGRKKGLRGLQ